MLSHTWTHKHALTSSYSHCCCARFCFMFVCGSSHTHIYTRVWNPVELSQQWKLAGFLQKGQSLLQITAVGQPGLVMDLNAPCVYPHLQSKRGETAAQPFCSTSRNSAVLSSPSLCMRNRWGGAIKWICCYFPGLLAEDVKPQPVTQPRMPACSGKHKHTCSPIRTPSAFKLLCNLSNCLRVWWMDSDLQRKIGIMYVLSCCSSHVTA